MKKIILILVIISTISCKAQNIVSYTSNQSLYVNNSNEYYKDVDNEFDKFIGRWKFQDGNTIFIIELKKDEHVDSSYGYFEDLLVGEYKYTENGATLINTLPEINEPITQNNIHSIMGVANMKKYYLPRCNDCTSNEIRAKLSIEKPDTVNRINGYIILRYINDNGVEKLELNLVESNIIIYDENQPQDFDMPTGNYVLIKE